jgi:hypothetical protein
MVRAWAMRGRMVGELRIIAGCEAQDVDERWALSRRYAVDLAQPHYLHFSRPLWERNTGRSRLQLTAQPLLIVPFHSSLIQLTSKCH